MRGQTRCKSAIMQNQATNAFKRTNGKAPSYGSDKLYNTKNDLILNVLLLYVTAVFMHFSFINCMSVKIRCIFSHVPFVILFDFLLLVSQSCRTHES